MPDMDCIHTWQKLHIVCFTTNITHRMPTDTKHANLSKDNAAILIVGEALSALKRMGT